MFPLLRFPCTVLAFSALITLIGCDAEKKSGTPQATDPKAKVDALEKNSEKGPVKMTVRLTPLKPRLSDMLEMDVIVRAPADVEVKPPPFGQAVGDFLVRDYSEKESQAPSRSATSSQTPASPASAAAERIWQFHYLLEPAHAGKHLIRSIPIEFTDRRAGSEQKDETVLLESEPLEIEVTSELGDKTPSLTDLSPMHAPMPLPPRAVWYWLAGGAALLAALIAIVFWIKNRRTLVAQPIVRRSPEEIAREELHSLLAANLHGTGQFKDFYVRLTGIVRRYIEGTTGIRAPEQTTEEFLRDMRSRSVFPPARSVQLQNFLESADLVKYAALEPSAPQIQDAIARAQDFIGLESALKPLPQTVADA